jgi:hypothetical protein
MASRREKVMNLYDELVHKLLKCGACKLRENGGDTIDYSSFGLYYFDQDAKKSKYIMVMQNPGLPSAWQNFEECKDYSKIKEGDDFVPNMQRYLIKWLKDKNPHFYKPFFESLREYGLICYNDLDKYLADDFFSDFLVTDLVKCRAKTENIKKDYIEKCAGDYLCKELECYAPRKLIFAFSSRTWEFLSLRFLVEKLNGDERRVSNVHGMLFKSNILNAHLIPLAHFSQRQFNNYLRNSYFDYLKEGLRDYNAKV